jgi:Ca2+-binding RTX toxin-like protein
MIGGVGSDTLAAGAGMDTLTGNGGNNLFLFNKAVIAGNAPTDIVTDFTSSNNSVLLAGYGAGAADAALTSATSSGGNTTLTLSDNTKITFLNASVANLTGHISSI